MLQGYDRGDHYCELLNAKDGPARQTLLSRLNTLDLIQFGTRARELDQMLYEHGVTFTVYSDKDVIDRVLPLDPVPRLITHTDWAVIENGATQRVRAMNMFIADIYGKQMVLKDGVIPRDLVLGNKNYVPQMEGLAVPHGTYVHIAGTDIVRGGDGTLYVLEDNGRTPSGVSYVVQNRYFLLREFPDLLNGLPIRPVSNYGERLHAAMAELAPPTIMDPQIVLLSPGIYNSAYFEHIFLAIEMGVPLVEGRDLFVTADDRVFMHTVGGPLPVDVIYRRIDDSFLDPEVFARESLLGVPGLMRAYRAGRVAIANAVGNGIADDKATYAYVPRLIEYYLSEKPILPNVPTWICREARDLAYTLDHFDDLVTKPVGESGGYGICIGPLASAQERAVAKARVEANPANYVAQPMIDLSVSPTLIDGSLEPRHVDLRPFIVTGKDSWVLPGGLTRVALPRGSMVVNSSQGGGTKDTWVLAHDQMEPGFGPEIDSARGST